MKQVSLVLFAAAALFNAKYAVGATNDSQRAFTEMKQAFGLVPSFFKLYPAEAVSGVWDQMKGLEMSPDAAIPGKYRNLISLAVSSQVPCRYCVLFDTEAARLEGATDAEIREAVTMGGIIRHWSTFLNGIQMDEVAFQNEVRQIVEFLKTGKVDGKTLEERKTAAVNEVKPSKASAIYTDIERTLGIVPRFLREFPENSIAGAWHDFKTVQLNPNSAIPNKYKELLGLAVSAQVPCRFCTTFHHEALKLNNATDQETREAVAIAASSRRWSTVFHGFQIEEKAFRKEVAQVMGHMRRQMAKEKNKLRSEVQ